MVDEHRPKLDRYECRIGEATRGLLYALVIGHITVSVICVMEVRNGYDAFRDGMVMKEGFLVLYACVLVAYIMHSLTLSPMEYYLARCACIGVGVTVFCVRILISRCLKRWLPEAVQKKLMHIYRKFIEPLYNHGMMAKSHQSMSAPAPIPSNSGRRSSAYMAIRDERDQSPIYTLDIPHEDSLAEMSKMMADEDRFAVFESMAKKAMCYENIRFLNAITEYKHRAMFALVSHSRNANDDIAVAADQIISRHVNSSADEEVNVSSNTRQSIISQRMAWQSYTPLLSQDKAVEILSQDKDKRMELFDKAYREISIMLYQNLWCKFRAEEAAAQMAGPNSRMMSVGPLG